MKQNEILAIVNKLGEITHAEKYECYTIISNAIDRQIIVALSLEKIERSMPEMKLFRVHKSHLVNINHISEIVEDGYNYHIKLVTGRTVPIAKRRKKELMNQLNLL